MSTRDFDAGHAPVDAPAAARHSEAAEAAQQISALRGTIDNIDDAVIHLLAERFKATTQVGMAKAKAGLAPADHRREDEQRSRLRRIAAESGLDERIADRYHELVVTEAKKSHRRIAEARQNADVPDLFI